MPTDLQNLTHSELIARLTARELQVAKLQQSLSNKDRLIAQYQRMIFGQKRERFEGDPAQGRLPFEADPIVETAREAAHEQATGTVRKKASRPTHNGRLPLPEHLPVEEVHIYPPGDYSEMVCIGQEVTDELEIQPARLYIKRYIRHKYAPAGGDGSPCIGALPDRAIDKGIAGPGLLATILVDKYMDHLPLYRQRQRFAREGVPIAQSTLAGWAGQAMDRLEILWDHLATDTKARGYLQVDESPIKVLENRNKGSCHRGWYWVYYSPIEKTVLFDYQPTRGAPGAKRMLDGFTTGYLQTDGYRVYDKIGQRKDVVHLACWAHARREFEKALDNDRERAQVALEYIQQLYAIERQARDEELSPDQRKELRLARALPIINKLGPWIHAEAKKVLPKSQIGKAMAYAAKRWDALSEYLHDGLLEIDNNLVENTIRPLALGRKNYLFAGSHKGARRAAMVYSLLGTCKLHGVNPTQWLTHVLANILQTKYKDVRTLYPQNFSQP